MNKLLTGYCMKGTILNLDISEKDVRRVDPFLIKNLANITYQQYGDADSEYDLFLYNLVNAVEQYCMLYQQESGLVDSMKNSGGWYETDEGIVCEYVLWNHRLIQNKTDGQETDCSQYPRIISFVDENLKVKAFWFNPVTEEVKPITLTPTKTAEMNAEFAVFTLCVALTSTSNSLHNTPYDELKKELLKVATLPVATPQHNDAAVALCVDLQTCFTLSPNDTSSMGWFQEQIKQMIPVYSQKDLPDLEKVTFGDLYGVKILKGETQKVASYGGREHTLSKLYGKYNFDPKRVRTPEERAMIEAMKLRLSPDTEVSDICLDIATEIQASTSLNFKFRDYMLKGPTGTGKTTMCVTLGLLLDLPVVTFNCDPDTDQLALGLSIVPNAKQDDHVDITLEDYMSSMPDVTMFDFDPVASYKDITGEEKNDASASDCMKAMMAKWSDICSKQANGFRYVYSNIAKAMKNGWIIEVQEPTVIQRPGVLTSLNSLTDDCAKMDLANGETIKRHPDAIMIYTTNLNLEGCYEMNQSQKSRFAQRTIELPKDEEVVRRLMDSTGFKEVDTVRKMVAVYNAARNYALSREITDGAIDFRALQAWATANLIFPTRVYENGINQFIEKCTEDAGQKAMFVTNCLETQFKPQELQRATGKIRL